MSYRDQIEEAVLAKAVRPLTSERLRRLMGDLDGFIADMQRQGIHADRAAVLMIYELESNNRGGYWGPIPGLKQITLVKVYWLSKAEIISANDEAERLGFSRTLDLAGLPEGSCPVVGAFHHTSVDRLRNIRLVIDLDKGRALLDVTGDRWEGIKRHAPTSKVKE